MGLLTFLYRSGYRLALALFLASGAVLILVVADLGVLCSMRAAGAAGGP